jgi:phage shock protein PspC (stress-responsive transcriptional regulator)
MAVFCHQCGAGLPPTARFCSACGTGIPFNQAAQPFPARPLIRPRAGRAIAGVCLALAQANGWDVAVVRVITVLGFCFSGGFVGIAYLAGWIGIPEEPYPGTFPPGSYPPSPNQPSQYPPNQNPSSSGAYPPGV